MSAEATEDLRMPHFEEALWERLDVMYDRAAAAPPTRRRIHMNGPLFAGLGLVAAATMIVAALVVGRGPDPSADRTVTGGVPADFSLDLVAGATSDDALAGTVIVERAEDGDWRTEQWLDPVTGLGRWRRLSPAGNPIVDQGPADPPTLDTPAVSTTLPEQCQDPATMDVNGTAVQIGCNDSLDDPYPVDRMMTINHCRQEYLVAEFPRLLRTADPTTSAAALRQQIELGMIEIDGTEMVDGVELVRLRGVPSSDPELVPTGPLDMPVYLVDPETYRPVRVTSNPNGTGQAVTTFEYLPRTAENLALMTPSLPDGYAETSLGLDEWSQVGGSQDPCD